MDGTPIYDIKPYLPQGDCHPEAAGGFTATHPRTVLEVEIPDELLCRVPAEHRAGLRGVLAQDPRPSYQNDPERIYGMDFAGCHVSFTVRDNRLTVCALTCDDAVDTRSKA